MYEVTTLHLPDPQKRWYCGPFSIAAITGHSFENIRSMINHVRRRPANTGIMGMYAEELERVFSNFGYTMFTAYQFHNEHWKDRPTFSQWRRRHIKGAKGKNEAYIVQFRKHFAVVLGDHFIDTKSGQKVRLEFAPYQMSRIVAVHKVKQNRR